MGCRVCSYVGCRGMEVGMDAGEVIGGVKEEEWCMEGRGPEPVA